MVPSSPSHRYAPRTDRGDAPVKATLGTHGAQPVTAVSLTPTHRIDEFVAAPLGRCVIGPTFAIWCASPILQGAIIWGSVDEQSIRDMMAAGRFVHHPKLAKRRRLLVDCRDITRVDADVLLGFTTLARDRVPVWAAGLERQAIIVPAGLAGILIGGALPSLGVSHPLRFAHDLDSALAFVEHPDARSAYDTAARISLATRGQTVLLSRLRVHLGRDPSAATVESSAGALGMSARTLQRELARLDTSFSDELRRLRVAAAEALLVHSDLKIDAVATRVGFGTASRMSATLRRELAVTASELRARSRGQRRGGRSDADP